MVQRLAADAPTPVPLDDFPRLWPLGLANNPRKWITENLSAGLVERATAVSLAIDVWPFAAVFLTGGPTRWLNLLSASLAMLT